MLYTLKWPDGQSVADSIVESMSDGDEQLRTLAALGLEATEAWQVECARKESLHRLSRASLHNCEELSAAFFSFANSVRTTIDGLDAIVESGRLDSVAVAHLRDDLLRALGHSLSQAKASTLEFEREASAIEQEVRSRCEFD
ncbi:hypothetical protein FOS14_21760 [Skermania sp. ID1734]|uniref:hypothetical protein n=1 Tax=Skermania sp. ID1734 TaxID=2597516 RepID=UPI00117D109B|nr:hypothetical protein [Skermania sp. ID1734]TSD93910.1 hypothetical protein FOS14_21760 [Skermania sp. ID1734]